MKPTLLVLAAGMGSRYGGVKQIAPVGKDGECLLDFASFDATKSGFGKVVYIIRKDIEKDFRERFFDRIAANIDAEYVFQSREALLSPKELETANKIKRTKPWGTVQAVLCAKDRINEPFAVINADDYYGRTAFETLGSYLSSVPVDSNEQAMVGYQLKNTMSRNGSVTRGLCCEQEGFLTDINETYNIRYSGEDFSGDKILAEDENNPRYLTGDEIASMNLFGFTPKAFEGLEEFWGLFKKYDMSVAGSEALLSVAAGYLIEKGDWKIKVFTSQESWFGMTYPEDRTVVIGEIAKKIQSGYYPEKLWIK